MMPTAHGPARLLGIAIAAAVVAGLGFAIAPSALAAPNSVVISSLDPGPVGVSATVTFSPAAQAAFLNVWVGLPMSQYSTAFTGDCASNGITVAINGTPLAGVCGHQTYGSLYSTLEVYNYWSSPSLSTTDVITLTWGPTAVTRTGPATLADFAVSADFVGQGFTMVTPTVFGSPSSPTGSAAGPDMTMWQQSVGRSSAGAPCPAGFTASWAQWPNVNQGGWVCNREVFAYRS